MTDPAENVQPNPVKKYTTECPTVITDNNVKDDKSHSLSSPQPKATSSKECKDGIVILSSTAQSNAKLGFCLLNLLIWGRTLHPWPEIADISSPRKFWTALAFQCIYP